MSGEKKGYERLIGISRRQPAALKERAHYLEKHAALETSRRTHTLLLLRMRLLFPLLLLFLLFILLLLLLLAPLHAQTAEIVNTSVKNLTF